MAHFATMITGAKGRFNSDLPHMKKIVVIVVVLVGSFGFGFKVRAATVYFDSTVYGHNTLQTLGGGFGFPIPNSAQIIGNTTSSNFSIRYYVDTPGGSAPPAQNFRGCVTSDCATNDLLATYSSYTGQDVYDDSGNIISYSSVSHQWITQVFTPTFPWSVPALNSYNHFQIDMFSNSSAIIGWNGTYIPVQINDFFVPPPPLAKVALVYPFNGSSTPNFRNWLVKFNVATASDTYWSIHMEYGQSTSSIGTYTDIFPVPNSNYSSQATAGFNDVYITMQKSLTFNNGENWCARPTLYLDNLPDFSDLLSQQKIVGDVVCFTIDNSLQITPSIFLNNTSTFPNITPQQAGQFVVQLTTPSNPQNYFGSNGLLYVPPSNASGTGDLCSQYYQSIGYQTPSSSVIASATLAWYEKVGAWLVCLPPFVYDQMNGTLNAIQTLPVVSLFTNLNGVVQGEVSATGTMSINNVGTANVYSEVDVYVPFLSSTIPLITSSSWSTTIDTSLKNQGFAVQDFFFALAPVGLATYLWFF